ncbi:MAG TPA: hypothetical protein PKI89_10365 [Tepidiformaceae bacterium]|nr:hypothetical protein [Tepidiformaceae bacterium]
MTAPPEAAGLVDIQRLAGNRAVQAAITRVNPAPPRQATPIQRLWSRSEFKEKTYAGFLSGRGKTMQQIDTLLGEYDEIKKTGGQLIPGSKQDRAINILHEIVEDIDIWFSTHEGDKSRSTKRIPGLVKLQADARKEAAELTGFREKSREFMGQKEEPVTRTENQFKTQMEGNFSSILTKLGPVFSAAAPASGDTGEIEIAVKVPVDPSGTGYLGFRIKASVERLKKKAMKMRFELAVVGGAKIGNVAEIGGELGMYLEAQGGTPEQALELISYGVYRRFRESSVLPREMANFIWGGSATAVGWNRSEKWAAKVEKENFKDKSTFTPGDSDTAGAYVETGGFAGAKAKGGIGGVVDAEGGAQYSTGQKYDYESVKGLKARHGEELGKAMKAPALRGAQHHLGESMHHLEFGFSATGGPFAGALKVGIDWSTQMRNKGAARLQAVKVGLEASASLPMEQLVAGGLGGYATAIGASVARGIRAAATGASTDKNTASQNVGEIIGGCENGATAITQIAQVPKEAFVPKFESGQPPPGFSAPVDLKLSVQGLYDFFEKKWVFEFKLEYIKNINVNAGVFEMKVKQGQRLIRVVYDGGEWSVD